MGKILLQGILFDEKSSYLRGAAKAPPIIRQAYHSDSGNYFTESGQEIRPDLFLDKGDFHITDYFDIEKLTLSNLAGRLPLISLGGDHSITYPLLKAVNQVYGTVDILHLDAHPDLYNDFGGDPHSHACPFARIMEEKLAGRLVQIGVRSFTEHQREQAKRFGVSVIPMHNLNTTQLPEFENPLYISLDVDVLDPAFAPGVSHLEPGGLTTRELLSVINGLKCPVIGADIVEFNPSRDLNGMTAMVCAKLLKEVAATMLLHRRQ